MQLSADTPCLFWQETGDNNINNNNIIDQDTESEITCDAWLRILLP
jgi:hypothetical protein